MDEIRESTDRFDDRVVQTHQAVPDVGSDIRPWSIEHASDICCSLAEVSRRFKISPGRVLELSVDTYSRYDWNLQPTMEQYRDWQLARSQDQGRTNGANSDTVDYWDAFEQTKIVWPDITQAVHGSAWTLSATISATPASLFRGKTTIYLAFWLPGQRGSSSARLPAAATCEVIGGSIA